MANIKGAVKSARQAEGRRITNRAVRARIAETRNSFFETVAGGDKAKSQELFRKYCSILDKAARHGVIKSNTASRRRSRAALMLARPVK